MQEMGKKKRQKKKTATEEGSMESSQGQASIKDGLAKLMQAG